MRPTMICVAALLARFALGLACSNLGFAAEAPPKFTVVRPTIIAFFALDTRVHEPHDVTESMLDFAAYVARAREALQQAGVDVHEVHVGEFSVRIAGKTLTFKAEGHRAGYYFVSPANRPRVEYGILLDDDILAIASAHFGMTIPEVAPAPR